VRWAVPQCRATATAIAVSSWLLAGNRTLNVAVDPPVARRCAATTSELSMPPLSRAATGTSAMACRPTASSKACSTSAAAWSSRRAWSGRAATSWKRTQCGPAALTVSAAPLGTASTLANPVAGSGT